MPTNTQDISESTFLKPVVRSVSAQGNWKAEMQKEKVNLRAFWSF